MGLVPRYLADRLAPETYPTQSVPHGSRSALLVPFAKRLRKEKAIANQITDFSLNRYSVRFVNA
ncbi:MAG: hypothetical protein AB1589_08005 [Cyanobacteriota bacterium]